LDYFSPLGEKGFAAERQAHPIQHPRYVKFRNTFVDDVTNALSADDLFDEWLERNDINKFPNLTKYVCHRTAL